MIGALLRTGLRSGTPIIIYALHSTTVSQGMTAREWAQSRAAKPVRQAAHAREEALAICDGLDRRRVQRAGLLQPRAEEPAHHHHRRGDAPLAGEWRRTIVPPPFDPTVAIVLGAGIPTLLLLCAIFFVRRRRARAKGREESERV